MLKQVSSRPPQGRDFFIVHSTIHFRDAEVMNIQFEGIRQFTPCMIFTSIDANVFRIVLAAMNFAFANFIDRRQQGIDIDADLTFCGIAVLFCGFHHLSSQPLLCCCRQSLSPPGIF
ncbi:hypothetical protein UTI89_C2154 [Escherichia coli UTI89]|uniref:Uncharacterized protein n=1 Tax=Escherichia coli (strain UTI89 / UPEC) TaxID=364106 RepID=Q1RAI7_ECOUT|nr:hypothetical protein UTI89_C2154 [Escherichia coli UTI89]